MEGMEQAPINPEVVKIQEINDMITAIYNADFDELQALNSSLRNLRKEYDADTLQKCKLWHAAIGGTIYMNEMPDMDLPGNVIENLIKAKFEEVTKKQ